MRRRRRRKRLARRENPDEEKRRRRFSTSRNIAYSRQVRRDVRQHLIDDRGLIAFVLHDTATQERVLLTEEQGRAHNNAFAACRVARASICQDVERTC